MERGGVLAGAARRASGRWSARSAPGGAASPTSSRRSSRDATLRHRGLSRAVPVLGDLSRHGVSGCPHRVCRRRRIAVARRRRRGLRLRAAHAAPAATRSARRISLVNMVSFQEMTDAQVRALCRDRRGGRLPAASTASIASDRRTTPSSISVSEALAERYQLTEVPVLSTRLHERDEEAAEGGEAGGAIGVQLPAPRRASRSVVRRARVAFRTGQSATAASHSDARLRRTRAASCSA